MAKIDRSVYIIIIFAILTCFYFTKFDFPIFSTGQKKSPIVSLEARVKKLEEEMAVIMKILGENKSGNNNNDNNNNGNNNNDNNNDKQNSDQTDKESNNNIDHNQSDDTNNQ